MAIIYISELHTIFEKVADFIAQKSKEAIQKKGSFYWALSGGQTPNEVFSLLARQPFKDDLNWAKTYVFWSDERYVDFNDRDNNSFNARQNLLDLVPIPSENVFYVPVNKPIRQAADEYESTIVERMGNLPVFDLVMLGLGADGHTASLFPGTNALTIEDRWVIAVEDEALDPKRISFTFQLINNAANVMFLVTGKNKARVVRHILKEASNSVQFPAEKVKPVHGQLYWFLDKEAMPEIIQQSPHKISQS